MQITRNSLNTTTGPADCFTGTVYIDTIAAPAASARTGASLVHFTPGARTAWHTHPPARPSMSPKASAAANAKADPSKRSATATASTSNPARTTGTVPPPTAS